LNNRDMTRGTTGVSGVGNPLMYDMIPIILENAAECFQNHSDHAGYGGVC